MTCGPDGRTLPSFTNRRFAISAISRRTVLKFSLAAPAVLLATTARAATHQVTIANMGFEPASLTIAAGDTVVFTPPPVTAGRLILGG